MGVTILAYGGFTRDQLKSRAEVPEQGSMILDAVNNGVNCSSIKVSTIRSALSTSIGSVSYLAGMANQWSYFGPKKWELTSSQLTNSVKTPYRLSYWAGYDHGAVGPYINGHTADFDFYEGQQNATFQASILLGQVDWMMIPFLKSVNMEVSINNAVVGVQHLALSADYLVNLQIFEVSASVLPYSSNVTASLRFYFGRDQANGWAEMCPIPNINTVNIGMTYKPKARLKSFTVAQSLKDYLGTSYAAVVFAANGSITLDDNRTYNYVSQLNGRLGSVTLSWFGVCTTASASPQIGQLNLIQAAHVAIWFRKNNGTWYFVDKPSPAPVRDTNTGGTYYTIFSLIDPNISLTYEDEVEIELRYID